MKTREKRFLTNRVLEGSAKGLTMDDGPSIECAIRALLSSSLLDEDKRRAKSGHAVEEEGVNKRERRTRLPATIILCLVDITDLTSTEAEYKLLKQLGFSEVILFLRFACNCNCDRNA